ncbi:MAG TPA: cation:proton antiporter [Gemmatimonadales bacterium]|nr:cation:proton antiporter [Gemmatimonadales bacterium]
MRRVAGLFALGVVMALLHRATANSPLEARATLALAFLLLAAYVGGDLARQARLPRITGYVLAGFAVGPAWLGLVRREEVEALGFLHDAALALIAFTVGSSLPLAEVRGNRLALTRVAAGAVVFPFVVVSLVTLSVTPWLPFTAHQPFGDRTAVSLVFGALAGASSPIVAMAVVEELDARGPFARGVLAVSVVQDFAVVILFAMVIVIGKALASAGTVSLAVAGFALGGVVGSLAVGLLLGYALRRAVHLARHDTLVLLLAFAFVATQVARLAHLETLIIALAAGFYLENAAPLLESERLRTDLKRGALVVYVLFFALSGAGLRVGVLAEWWPWALLLIGLRVVSLRYGVRWAGRHGAGGGGGGANVTPALARDGWLGLISQVGMAVVLTQLARRAFPEWGVSLETLLVAMIGVHTVVGPICFRWALERAGEFTGTSGGGGASNAEGSVGGGSVLAPRGGV